MANVENETPEAYLESLDDAIRRYETAKCLGRDQRSQRLSLARALRSSTVNRRLQVDDESLARLEHAASHFEDVVKSAPIDTRGVLLLRGVLRRRNAVRVGRAFHKLRYSAVPRLIESPIVRGSRVLSRYLRRSDRILTHRALRDWHRSAALSTIVARHYALATTLTHRTQNRLRLRIAFLRMAALRPKEEQTILLGRQRALPSPTMTLLLLFLFGTGGLLALLTFVVAQGCQ